MILDIICAVIILLAVLKGYGQGLIVGVFSFFAIAIGLAAALKLSAVVAGWIGETAKITEEWLPLISFIVVFILAVLLVRLGARALQNAVEVVLLGWINRLGGVLFFLAIYLTVFSILLFYAVQMKWVPDSETKNSITYSYVHPIGPKIISVLGSLVPFFRHMFEQLQDFFGSVADQVASN